VVFHQRKAEQWEQKVGCLKNVAMNLWPAASWTLWCLIAPLCRAIPRRVGGVWRPLSSLTGTESVTYIHNHDHQKRSKPLWLVDTYRRSIQVHIHLWIEALRVVLQHRIFCQYFRESFAKISVLKIESFRNLDTIFKILAKIVISKMLAKIKISESIVNVISQLILLGGAGK